MFCTEMPIEERCEGCPLSARENNTLRRPIEPHQRYRLTVQTLRILDCVSELDDSDPVSLKAALISAHADVQQELEPADQHLDSTIRDIANWRMVGACEYHEGPILRDPELEARMEQIFGTTTMN